MKPRGEAQSTEDDHLKPYECSDCEYLSNEFRDDFNARARKCWEERKAEHLTRQHQQPDHPDGDERREMETPTESLESLLSRVSPENLHEETDWGEPVGREFPF